MTFLLYLGKVMLCSGILLGYYWLFLRNRRFHHYNRFYLQATLLVSVVLPFLRIPLLDQSRNAVNQAVYQTIEVLTVNYGEEEVAAKAPGLLAKLLTFENVLYLLYAAGIAILLWTLVRSLLYIKNISKKYPFERVSGLKFFTTTEPGTPFSFFRSIFWNKDLQFNSPDGQQIFRHELFHVEQKHSTDIILTEIVTAFFWFNPFFHILKKELKAIHEFLADQYAISNSDRYAYAELLIVQTLKANQISISNYFFQNHIKRRIAMITNNHSARYSYGSRLMALPLLVLLFCTVALYAQRGNNYPEKVSYTGADKEPLTVVVDAGHGGIDAGASIEGINEKDLNLQICKKIQELAPAYNVKVIMTRSDDQLPGNLSVIHDALKARVAIAEQVKADLFVAIHVSAAGSGKGFDPKYSGFEVYVSNDNNSRVEQSKQLGSAVLQELSKLYTTNTTLRQRGDKGIYVLDKSPCPAVLVECGFITNEKDLAFISNTSNQEAIAKKILEGIVNTKNKAVTVVEPTIETEKRIKVKPVENAVANADTYTEAKKPTKVKPVENARPVTITRTPAPATGTTDPAFEQNMMKALEKAAERSRKKTVVYQRPAIYYEEVPQPAIQEVRFDPTDPVTQKLSRHFCRETRYPNQVLTNNGEGVVYFSISVDASGEIKKIQLYDQAPADAGIIGKITVIGYGDDSKVPATPISKKEINNVLQREVKRVGEKKLDLTGMNPQSTPYYFRIEFKVDGKKTVTT
jgi:N-acetylmuramoyl-L-alanine amidase